MNNIEIKETLSKDNHNNYIIEKNNYSCSCCGIASANFTNFKRHVNSTRHKRIYWLLYSKNISFNFQREHQCTTCNYITPKFAKMKAHLDSKKHLANL